MKLTGPDAVPPPLSSSLLERIFDRLVPAPEPPLKMIPSSRYQLRIESIVSSTSRMKHALAWARTPGTPMLNHTGLLNAARWVTRMYFSSSENADGLGVVAEVAALDAPPGDRVDDAVDDLAQRRLPLGRAERAAEVLLGDDVGGVLRPAGGNLDAELLEHHRPVSDVGDARVTPLPHDLVVGIDPLRREQPAEADPEGIRGNRHPWAPFAHVELQHCSYRLSIFHRADSWPTHRGPKGSDRRHDSAGSEPPKGPTSAVCAVDQQSALTYRRRFRLRA